MSPSQSTQRARSGGYVLLMALMLVLLVALALAGVARASLDEGLKANAAEDELQWRWGRRSLEAACLPQARQWLEQTNQQAGSASQVSASVTLAGTRFDVIVSDEQAKINLNTLHREHQDQALKRLVKLTLREAKVDDVSIQLAPLELTGDETFALPYLSAFGGLEQAFDVTPATLLDGIADQRGPAALFTCWGDGKLNVFRAERAAIHVVCESELSPVQRQRLFAALRRDAGSSLSQLLGTLAMSNDERGRLEAKLTDESNCFSIWIAARNGPRKRYALTVVTDTAVAGETADLPAQQNVEAAFEW